MCGRTCLTLEPNQIVCACKYKTTKSLKKEATEKSSNSNNQECSEYKVPEWRPEFNCGRVYIPSYNIAPTDMTPILVSSDHFCEEKETKTTERIIIPMMWSMIPFWHRGDYRKHKLTTNNCRLESMLDSKLFRGPFRRGQRCVVLCEGFYEWSTIKPAKPSERLAYLIYLPQEANVKIYDNSTFNPENINLLKMAGLFDVWVDDNGDKMYSYSIITFESTKVMSWLHHRMPAILETEQQVNDWLDFKRVNDEEALAILQPATELKWHRVSNLVNNSRNKSDKCNKPIENGLNQKQQKKGSLLSWLNVHKRDKEDKEKLNNDQDNVSNFKVEIKNDENPPKRRCLEKFITENEK